MCNASPGHRCDGDSYSTVEKSVDRYSEKIAEFNMMERPEPKNKTEYKKWRNKKESLTKEKESLAKKVEFYYSTNKSQEEGVAQQRKMTALLKNKLNPKEIASLGISQSEARRTGHHINGFHSLFTESMKNDPDKNHLNNTRKMFNGGFEEHRDNLMKTAKLQYGAALDKIEYENPDKDVTKLNYNAKQAYFKEARTIRKAYQHSQEEARTVVREDCDANSQGYKNSIQKTETAFIKNTDGSFTIHTKFNVEGRNLGDAIIKNEASFKNVDVQATYAQVDDEDNTYVVKNKYVYTGGAEKLKDVEKHFYDKVWNDTPAWRQTMAQVRYLEDNPY